MRLSHRWNAWSELWQRYRRVFVHFWAQRESLASPALKPHEAEFLPATLSLQTRPVSPAGRWVARVLMALVLAVLLWSILGQIDVTVNASGKIIPSGRTKTISAVEVASVRALHVVEGQSVRAGDLLIELDTRASDSERDKAEGDRQVAMLQAARSRALIAAIEEHSSPRLGPVDGVSPELWRDASRHLSGQWQDYAAKAQRLDGQIRRYREALPLAAQRARDYAALVKTGDVSAHAASEKEQARVDLEGQLDEARHQLAALRAETRRAAQDALSEASRIVASSSQDVRRAGVRSELLRLLAPVDGTVQQLSAHTVGGVVPAAQALMQIVPLQSAVEIEAFLENKDVGFVQEGQRAAVKIDAFEYTKYGTLAGRVSHIARDAMQDEEKGWIYAIKVLLDDPSMEVDGREVALSPGMSTRVEVKTGTRRVIEYVLSPLIRHGRESLNER